MGGSEDLWRYREAAAVLASFDYGTLQASGVVSSSSSAKAELLADCEVAYNTEGTPIWSLRAPMRRAALRRLIAENRVQTALNANPKRLSSPVQKLLEGYLGSNPPSISDAQVSEQGNALLEVIEWLDGIPEVAQSLPLRESVKHRLARWQLLHPFRELVGSYFAGRKEELSTLADYVGVHASAHLLESLGRTVEYIFNIHDRPPLFVNGPGGCGKSTLIAKFILQHAEVEESARFPFAYLDFDRPGLLAEEPVTLIMEIMRQLAIQFPSSSDQYKGLADEWSVRVAKEQEVLAETDATPIEFGKGTLQEAQKAFRIGDRKGFMSEFAEFVKSTKTDEQPLLLVLDTFEEVQFRSSAFVEEVLVFLNDLQSMVPRLRTVLCGRADIRSSRFKVRKIEIGNFDEEAAISFLTGLGVTTSQITIKIVDQVGGSPLVLRLAADVARLENVDQSGIDELWTGWFSMFRQKSVEVVLYKRILSHVRDKRVGQLAYPGLVLRIITPEVVQRILAPACAITLASDDDAREIVTTMRVQLSTLLVPNSGDDAILVHRPDMRSILLQDVSEKAQRDKMVLEQLSRIHRMAIDFYGEYEDPAHRAEEIYHRLALGIDRPMLAARWQDGLKPYLGSSIRELPPGSQVYLAARMDLELAAEQWSQAEDEDWILYARRLATQQLQLERPFDALDVLNQRKQTWETESLQPVMELVIDALCHYYANQYEEIREKQAAGAARTRQMNALVTSVGALINTLPVKRSYARRLFAEKRPGTRVVALGIAEKRPYPEHMDMAIDTIEESISPFEQYHALLVAQRLLSRSTKDQRKKLYEALLFQKGTPIHESDPSRANIKQALLHALRGEATNQLEPVNYRLVEVKVPATVTYRDDPNERHGPFVLTRGKHELELLMPFRMGIYPVTNHQFLSFVKDGGYLTDALWEGTSRSKFLTQDHKTRGPSTWSSSSQYPPEQKNHPVSGVSYLEAKAFVRWLHRKYPNPEWIWCLPSEDMWEVSARSPAGLQYPWGSGFRPDHCNSTERCRRPNCPITWLVFNSSAANNEVVPLRL